MDSNFESNLLTNDTKDDTLDKTTFWKYVWRFTLYYLIVLLFVVNITAASIALQINRGKNFFSKMMAFIFALFFGIIYILINYYYYRILVKGETSSYFCSENIFPF